jgi:hypothetical protein
MYLPMTTCESCEGSRKTPSQRRVPVTGGRPDLTYVQLDPTREMPAPAACGSCDGHGVRRADGYSAYRSAKAAQTGRDSGKAQRCDSCKGSGVTVLVPVLEECYSCRGTGEQPMWDPARPYLPEGFEHTRSVPADTMRAWAGDVRLVVVRRAGTLSWSATRPVARSAILHHCVWCPASCSRTDATISSSLRAAIAP